MKKSTKFGLGASLLLLGTVALSGCTASFCSVDDKAHILYMYDFGVSEYYNDAGSGDATHEPVRGFSNLYVSANRPTDSKSGIGTADSNALKAYVAIPTNKYFIEFDTTLLQHATVEMYNIEASTKVTTFSEVPSSYTDKIVSRTEANKNDASKVFVQDILDVFGYIKFADSFNAKQKLWTNFDQYVEETHALIGGATPVLTIDDLASNDYINVYKNAMNSTVSQFRSCIAISKDKYGYYGYGTTRDKVEIGAKDWGYAWKTGFLEGLLIYPIAWLTDTLVNAFSGLGAGWSQLVAILVVTVIVRALMLAVTLKQTTANVKMQALQPEMTKIQNKYPNANTNQYEKQRMAEEMQKLYKKNGINPLGSMLIMVVQFPVFICVWGALQGAASLSSDAFLGLNLSLTIREVLFSQVYWTAEGGFGAVTALVLFLLMSGAQVVSMLLPQWFQKRAEKKAVKLGKNPAKKSQDNRMKWFTYIMMAMIIFMGFSLASAMGVYWLAGALFSIVQTIITTNINNNKKRK